MAVDIHAHVLPARLVGELGRKRRKGFPVVGEDGRLVFDGRRTPVPQRELTDVGLRLRDMDRMGVDIQVVSPWVELSPASADGRGEADFLRLLNDALAAEIAEHPHRLRGLGLVSRRDPAEATLELIRMAAMRGMVGVELTAGGPGPALHNEAWETFWHTASELRCVVLLHPWQAGCSADADIAGIRDIVDNPAQTTATVTALLLAGVVQRHSGLNLCLVHGGGSLPYLLGRLIRLGEPLRAAPGRDGSVASGIRRLWFDSLTHSSEALSFLANQMGADRVVLGTDYPFGTGDSDGVARVRAALSLSSDDKTAILRDNAIRLLDGLDTVPSTSV
jgi:aminocarboxymuconate-semialdehyde decarboxylase